MLGIGIPLILFFFQEDGTMFTIDGNKIISRKLTDKEINELESQRLKMNEELKSRPLALSDPWELIALGPIKRDTVWTLFIHQNIDIRYRRFIGIGLFAFSFFPKK